MTRKDEFNKSDALDPGDDPCPSSGGILRQIRLLFGRDLPVEEAPDGTSAAEQDSEALADQLSVLIAPSLRPLETKLEALSRQMVQYLEGELTALPKAPASSITSDLTEALSFSFKPVEERLDGLNLLFQEKIQDDQTKTDLFQKLYEDLTRYRDDFLFKQITRPVFNDLVQLYDRLDDTLAPDILANLSREDLVDRLTRFQRKVRTTLERHGVTMIEDTGDRFNATFQEAIDVVPVADVGDNERVIKIRREGFEYRGKVLRPQKVLVGRYISNREGENG